MNTQKTTLEWFENLPTANKSSIIFLYLLLLVLSEWTEKLTILLIEWTADKLYLPVHCTIMYLKVWHAESFYV